MRIDRCKLTGNITIGQSRSTDRVHAAGGMLLLVLLLVLLSLLPCTYAKAFVRMQACHVGSAVADAETGRAETKGCYLDSLLDHCLLPTAASVGRVAQTSQSSERAARASQSPTGGQLRVDAAKRRRRRLRGAARRGGPRMARAAGREASADGAGRHSCTRHDDLIAWLSLFLCKSQRDRDSSP